MKKTNSQNIWPRIHSNKWTNSNCEKCGFTNVYFSSASAAKFWKCYISSASEKIFPGVFTIFGVAVDWCCFYYSVRNRVVALLEALRARIFSFRFLNIGGFLTFCFLCVQGLQRTFVSASLNQVPVPGCQHSSCVLIVHVCLCVCASVCACENV